MGNCDESTSENKKIYNFSRISLLIVILTVIDKLYITGSFSIALLKILLSVTNDDICL